MTQTQKTRPEGDSAEPAPGPSGGPDRRGRLARLLRHRLAAITLLLAVLTIGFSVFLDGFATTANLSTLLSSVSILFVVALGLTFVLLVGGFDLSIGSTLALAGIVLAWAFNDLGLPMPLAIAVTLLFGVVLGGFVNGFLIGYLKVSFMVVTLGTLSLFRGLVNLGSGGETQSVTSPIMDFLAFGSIAAVPVPVLVGLLALAGSWYVLRYTFFGRDVYAVGGNEVAARLSGIRVSRTVMSAYAIAGVAAALGGVLQVSRLGAASPLVGETIMFSAAAAVLLGGTSLRGGTGSVVGTAVGVVFLGVLTNGLSIAGLPSYWQQIASGAIVASAAVIDKAQRDGWGSLRPRLNA